MGRATPPNYVISDRSEAMHTAEELERADFQYRAGGRPVDRDDVLPTMATTDRLGVVMGHGLDGLGAGNAVLSCVTDFYDRLRAEGEDFFEYPDYYTFQATTEPADYGMLDVWPDHKDVVVEPDAEQVLRAVVDRAIDVLLVPAGPPGAPEIEDVTRRSAERRIDDCFLYAPDGTLDEPGFSIELPSSPAGDWYDSVVDSASPRSDADRERLRWNEETHVTQEYCRIPLDRALAQVPDVDRS